MSFRIVKARDCRCSTQISAFLYHALQYEFPSFDAAVLFLMEFVPANERHLAEIREPDAAIRSIAVIAARYTEVTGRQPGHIRTRCAECGCADGLGCASRTPQAPGAGSAPPAASAW